MRLQDVKGDEEWSALEAELLRCAPLGKVAVLPGKDDCPEDTTDPARRVRAGLIRWLLLGGDEALATHSEGVQLRGAWVQGVLDFANCSTELDFGVFECLLQNDMIFRDAKVGGIFMNRCHVLGRLNMQRIQVRGVIHLRHGSRFDKGVDLSGSSIGGILDLDAARLTGRENAALNAALNLEGAVVGGDVFLRDGFGADGKASHFQAHGPVKIIRAHIRGSLQIIGARIDGRIDGEAARCDAGFFFQNVTGMQKLVDLRHASLGVLRDDKASWDGVGTLHLDGLSYDRIDSAMTVADRIAWLDRNRDGTKDAGDRFLPQPWTQLAKVLTASGDRRAASRVREAREVRIARAEIRQAWKAAGVSSYGPFPFVPVLAKCVLNLLFRALFGYGHSPGRVWFTILPLLAGTALLFGHIYAMGQMAPNSAVILTSADWQAALRLAGEAGQPLFHWAGMNGYPPMPSAIDYETFSRILYAFDLFIPLDAIGQQQAWAPSHDRGFWGAVGYWARFPIQVAGWVIAAVGAAVVTGLLGKKDDG